MWRQISRRRRMEQRARKIKREENRRAERRRRPRRVAEELGRSNGAMAALTLSLSLSL